MHVAAAAAFVLILFAIVGMGMMGGGGMPVGWHSSMPHMGWSRSAATGAAQAPVVGAPTTAVALTDFAFRPREIRATAGQPVNLQLSNQSSLTHDLTIPGLGYHAVVQPGQELTVGFSAPAAGSYEFYCSIPGHRDAGMVGMLVVAP